MNGSIARVQLGQIVASSGKVENRRKRKKQSILQGRKEGRKEARGVTTRRGKSKNDIEDNSKKLF